MRYIFFCNQIILLSSYLYYSIVLFSFFLCIFLNLFLFVQNFQIAYLFFSVDMKYFQLLASLYEGHHCRMMSGDLFQNSLFVFVLNDKKNSRLTYFDKNFLTLCSVDYIRLKPLLIVLYRFRLKSYFSFLFCCLTRQPMPIL